ncbi:DUF4148 domain-containing protein [Paraburkholderia fungorum]|uniref:DUF4148 domain-containing protein n=1 Tax=Paraburkholderia fungorum TaxID=134537 RepID=UPI0038B7E45C
MLKSLIPAFVLASALAMPAVSFAQSNGPVTRAQVRAELVQIEKAGYHVSDGEHTSYPVGIQAAEAKVAAENGVASGYGGAIAGSSEAGRPVVSTADWNAMYSRH